MIIKDFFKLAEDVKLNHNSDESSLLDSVTPTYLTMMNTLSDIEKHIIFALIIRPRKVIKKDVTKKDLSNYLTAKDLSDEIKLQTKELSVYLKRLFDSGLINRKLFNKKDYEYNVTDELFIKWFIFRNKKTNSKVQEIVMSNSLVNESELGKKVESESDFHKNTFYSTKTSKNLWQLMCWDADEVILWSNNNSTITRRFKRDTFIKNWYQSK